MAFQLPPVKCSIDVRKNFFHSTVLKEDLMRKHLTETSRQN